MHKRTNSFSLFCWTRLCHSPKPDQLCFCCRVHTKVLLCESWQVFDPSLVWLRAGHLPPRQLREQAIDLLSSEHVADRGLTSGWLGWSWWCLQNTRPQAQGVLFNTLSSLRGASWTPAPPIGTAHPPGPIESIVRERPATRDRSVGMEVRVEDWVTTSCSLS